MEIQLNYAIIKYFELQQFKVLHYHFFSNLRAFVQTTRVNALLQFYSFTVASQIVTVKVQLS